MKYAIKWLKGYWRDLGNELWAKWSNLCFYHIIEGNATWGELILACILYRIWMHLIEPDAVIFMTLGF